MPGAGGIVAQALTEGLWQEGIANCTIMLSAPNESVSSRSKTNLLRYEYRNVSINYIFYQFEN